MGYGQDLDPDKLEEIQKQTEAEAQIENEIKAKRDQVLSEIKSLKTNINQTSSQISRLSQQESEMSQELSQLEIQKSELEAIITKDKASMTRIMAALQRIENNPPPSFAVRPNDAADSVRAGLLMRNVNSQLGLRVTRLKTSLDELELLRADIANKKAAQNSNRQKLQAKQSILQNQVTEKNQLERSLTADYGEAQARRQALAAEAQNLQELINRLEYSSREVIPRIKPDPNAPKSEQPAISNRRETRPVNLSSDDIRFSRSKGNLFSPVTGTLVKGYSSAHPGITIETEGSTEVFAPAAGRIDFAGAFKNYGNVVIINAGDGYFILLTGLGQLHIQGGSDVSAGDSLALMPVNSASNEKLYIEVRKNGSTLDPVPWFGTTFAHR